MIDVEREYFDQLMFGTLTLHDILDYVPHPSDELLIKIVENYRYNLSPLFKLIVVSTDVQIAAVTNNGYCIVYISEPGVEIQRAAANGYNPVLFVHAMTEMKQRTSRMIQWMAAKRIKELNRVGILNHDDWDFFDTDVQEYLRNKS